MNIYVRAFLDGMLIENPVFMTFVGALLIVVLPRSARSSVLPATRFGVVFFFTATIGVTLAAIVPPLAVPLVFLLVALAAVAALTWMGELKDTWFGMPQTVLAIAPLVGMQMLIASRADLAVALAVGGGSALGLLGAFVIVGAIRETSKISEASPLFKTNPVVLYSMGIFALILTGFLFW